MEWCIIIWNFCVLYSKNYITEIFSYIIAINFLLQFVLSMAGKTIYLSTKIYSCFGINIEEKYPDNIRCNAQNFEQVKNILTDENVRHLDKYLMWCYHFDVIFMWRLIFGLLPLFIYNCVVLHESTDDVKIALLVVFLLFISFKCIFRKIAGKHIERMNTLAQVSLMTSDV